MSVIPKIRKKQIAFAIGILFLFLVIAAVLALHFQPGLRSSLVRALPFMEKQHSAPVITGKLSIHFIDVGQGDAALILTPEGQAVLLDCGPTDMQNELTEYLRIFGVNAIDCLILTHPHPDHIGGAIEILDHFPVRQILHSASEDETTLFARLSKKISEKAVPNAVPQPGDHFFFGSVKLSFLGPIADGHLSLNDDSLVCRLTYGQTAFLFLGDAEKQEEEEMLTRFSSDELHADVMKVGHHGSSTSSAFSFLQAVSPSYAVISCGKANEYGHPHSSVLAALDSLSVTVLRTDQSGTVVFVSDGSRLTIENPFTRQ